MATCLISANQDERKTTPKLAWCNERVKTRVRERDNGKRDGKMTNTKLLVRCSCRATRGVGGLTTCPLCVFLSWDCCFEPARKQIEIFPEGSSGCCNLHCSISWSDRDATYTSLAGRRRWCWRCNIRRVREMEKMLTFPRKPHTNTHGHTHAGRQ